MAQFGTQKDLDDAIIALQQWLDRGWWVDSEQELRQIYEWYVWLANQGANTHRFNAPLTFWVRAGNFRIRDHSTAATMATRTVSESSLAYHRGSEPGGGDDQPGSSYRPADDQPGPSRYPTVQGSRSILHAVPEYGLAYHRGSEPGGGDDQPGSSYRPADDQPGPSRYPTLQGSWQKTNNYATVSDDRSESSQSGGANGLESEADEGQFFPKHYYEINQADAPVYARKFRTERKHYTVNFRYTDELINADDKLEPIFNSILHDLLDGFTPDDMTGLQIDHPALGQPIYIPLTKHSNLSGFKILAEIMKVQQSRKDLQIDENLSIKTVSVRPPNGSGWAPRSVDLDDYLKKSKSIIVIKNNKDDFCMARGIVTAMARQRKDPEYKNICLGDRGYANSEQKRRAIELMRNAGLANHRGPCGIPEAMAMQAVFKDEFQLKIFANDQQSFIFQGASEAKAIIYLFLKDGHYDVITKMPAFFNRSWWCETCEIAYNNKGHHKCPNLCPKCFNLPPCQPGESVTCDDCNRYFSSRRCFENHKVLKSGYVTEGKKKRKTESSVCIRNKVCRECGQYIRDFNSTKHVCNSFECPTCRNTVIKGEHKCYIQPLACLEDNEGDDDDDDDDEDNAGRDLREAREAAPTKYVFFDFETTQCIPIGENEHGTIYKHIANLCIAHTDCDSCRNTDTNTCHRCGPRERIFKGETCLNDFCKWLFSSGSKKCPVIAVAHNAKGFDGQFILSYLEQQGNLKPTIIDKGLELMSIEAGYVKIMDSMNFLPMALSSLPKAFELDELAKGYFPHMFNRPENWSYVGAWPAKEHYAPNSMKDGVRREFDRWYDQQAGKTFNFEEEIIKYCRSDVDILRRAALKFRDIFLKTTRIDPFEGSLTIASACNRVFRSLFLKANTIGIIPHGGYRTKQRQSLVGLKWIKWLARARNIRIEHAKNGGEFRIPGQNFLADGRYKKQIFEFNGCYWHGCKRCMTNRRQKTAEQQLTADEAYNRTILRRAAIESAGFKVTEMWECDLKQQLKVDQEMSDFFDSLKFVPPMDPREAFYGGRTNAVRLYDFIEKDEQGRPLEHIEYMDVCSLYPYICKYGRFPIGHPEIITENFEDLAGRPYEGLIKCKILPPRRLLHPVLPYRSNGKLTFPLCAPCADSMATEPCTHIDDQRAISGCWVSLEIYKALELGYQVVDIYEVYHYHEVSQYDPETKLGGLFAEYTNMFVKMKQQADGWPAWVQTDADKEQYVADYMEREGIQLEKDGIAKNPGLRSLSKLMLNSFWGKFGQRNNKRKSEYFKDPEAYFKCITDPARIIHKISIVNEHMVRVVWSMGEEFVEVLGNTNPIIAAYTTAQARLKLYSYIEKLNDRLIYFDTDSVVFKTRLDDPNQYRVPTGSYLGDMTNELKDFGPGAYIEEFTSTGPKSYAAKIFCPKDGEYRYIVKAKGFSLTSAASQVINFESMKEMVHLYVQQQVGQKLNVDFFQIARKPDHEVVTRPVRKAIRVVYTKRVIQPDFSTLPYGY